MSVQVSEGQGRVTLEVRDEGTGFDPERVYAGHLGLDLLRSRAADAGGSATIGSRPGEGTSVVVSVPVPLNAPADRDPL